MWGLYVVSSQILAPCRAHGRCRAGGAAAACRAGGGAAEGVRRRQDGFHPRSGTDPLSAPPEFRFDPANILSQLESLYSFYVNTMRFTPETGLLAQYKIIVIVTRTWNRTALDAWATGGRPAAPVPPGPT
jgi:hypothetical protein